jgi:hypothetical protein
MHPNATIYHRYEYGVIQLSEGYNGVELHVSREGDNRYYDIYNVQIYRQTEAESGAQAAAIAQIEALMDTSPYIDDFEEVLNTATGLNTAISGNSYSYRNAVIAAADGALDTSSKIAALVDYVNHREDTRLSSLELTGLTLSPTFSPDNSYYTATAASHMTSTTISATTINPNATILARDLGTHTLIEGHDNSIQLYITPESGNYYDIISINIYRESGAEQLAAIAKIEAVTNSAESITILDLNTATGLASAIDANLEAYRDAIVAATPGTLGKLTEIENLVDIVNEEGQVVAIAEIEAYTESTQTDLLGLLGAAMLSSIEIKEENLEAYRSAILAKADGELDSWYEIYQMVSLINDPNQT